MPSGYEHTTAYRHENGEVEGFIGFGGTKAKAKADAIDQIQRKLDDFGLTSEDLPLFDKSRIVTVLSSVTRAEMDTIQKDWRSGVRY